MKKTSIQRVLSECINLAMALLLVIPLGIAVEQFLGYPLFRCGLLPCLSGIGYVLGRVSMRRSMGLSMGLCGVGVVLGGILSLVLCPAGTLVHVLIFLLTVFFSAFFFFAARKAGYSIYSPMAVTGILLHVLVLIICTGMQWKDSVARVLSIVSIAFFLLSLFSFSSKGLRKSMQRSVSEKRIRYPAGIQMGNFLLVTGFIIAAAFVSNIYPIFRLFSAGFAYVVQAIIAFFAYLATLIKHKPIGSDPVTEKEPSIAEDSILNAEPKGEAGWVTNRVEIIAFVVVLLVVIYALYRLLMKLREKGVRLPAFFQRFKDRFAPVADEDYVDETESLFDAKEMLGETRARMKRALKKLRERPQKLEDFPDNRMKVRFAFQQLLKRSVSRQPGASAMTPEELLRKDYPGEPDTAALVDYYNKARYSEEPIPDDAAACARTVLKKRL